MMFHISNTLKEDTVIMVTIPLHKGVPLLMTKKAHFIGAPKGLDFGFICLAPLTLRLTSFNLRFGDC